MTVGAFFSVKLYRDSPEDFLRSQEVKELSQMLI